MALQDYTTEELKAEIERREKLLAILKDSEYVKLCKEANADSVAEILLEWLKEPNTKGEE